MTAGESVALPRDVEARIVSMLAKGTPPDMVARRLSRPADQVRDVAARHGGSDLGALCRAAERLETAPAPDLVVRAASVPELAPLAAAAQRALDDLHAAMEAQESRQKAAAELAQLELEISQRQKRADKLRALLEPSSAQVRAWAASQGIELNRAGRIPARVMDAWRKAHHHAR